MSIRFPTDNDAGMSRQNTPRRSGGGGKIFFMLIFGVIAFMVMRGMRSGPSAPAESNPTDRRGGIGSTEQLELLTDKFPAENGDWGMEDGPVQKNAASKKPTTRSSNADWGMEDVTTQPSAQQPVGRFSQSSNAPVKASENKQPITQGDWSLDSNLDTAPKPATPKKTVKGDWGLEEVE